MKSSSLVFLRIIQCSIWTAAMLVSVHPLLAAPLPTLAPRQDFWITDGPVLSLLEHNNTLYVGGNFANVGPNTGKAAILPNATASPDLSWPKLTASVKAAVPDGSGGWYAGGESLDDGYLLTHLKADKTVDTEFDLGPNAQINALLKDGNILYVGGGFTGIGTSNRNFVAAIDLTTGRPTAWNPNLNSTVNALAKSGNTIFVGGAFTTVGGEERRGLAAIDATTGSALDFPAVEDIGGIVHALLVAEDTLYVGGGFTTIGGEDRPSLASIDISSALVNTDFNAGAFEATDSRVVLALASDGATLYVGGGFAKIGDVSSRMLAALNPTTGANLELDMNIAHFGSAWVSTLVLSEGNLYFGGRFDTIDGVNRNYLAAIETENNTLLSWNPRAAGGTFPVETLAHDGLNFLVGGDLVTVGAVARKYLAAIDLNTGEAMSWNPNPTLDGVVWALAQHNGVIYAGGQSVFSAIDADANVTGVNAGQFGSVYQLIVSGDDLYVGGGFTINANHNHLAKYDLSSEPTLVPTWNPNPLGDVLAMVLDGSTLYVGGQFTEIAGEERNYIAALEADTGAATEWNPNASFSISSLAVGESAVYASGSFSTIGGQSRQGLAALNKSTGQATTWNPAASTSGLFADAMEVVGTHLLLGGSFNLGGLAHFAVVDTESGQPLSLNLEVHPLGRIFKIHRGSRHYYLGGNQAGSRDVPRPNLSAHRLTPFLYPPTVQLGGNVVVDLDGLPDQAYLIEVTADLINWQQLGVFSSQSGAISATHQDAGSLDHRFYRASETTQPE